jgi:uncharacterized membrane protein YkvA (DUF1232 family)
MTRWSWLAAAVLVFAAIYAIFVVVLFVLGRRGGARALAGFIPDCAMLFARMSRDRRVPRRDKLFIGALVVYLSLPFDLVPDFIPVAGQLDDVLIVAFVLRTVFRHTGPELIREHWPGPESSLRLMLRLAGAQAPTDTAD